MTKKVDSIKRNTDAYINSVVNINRRYGFDEIPQESIEKAKSDVEKASRKLQKLFEQP